MGTDIHMTVDRYVNGEWDEVDCEVWDDRSYVTFAVLADVRNGFGVAGCKTHTPVPPIARPRGLPAGVTSVYGDGDDRRWLGDHSFSWLLLDEVLTYDWSREIVEYGVVPVFDDVGRRAFKMFPADSLETMLRDGRSEPTTYSGGIAGPDIVKVSYPDAVAMLADPSSAEPGKRYYTGVEWKVSLEAACAPFLAWARSLVEFGDPGEVRLVFGFDS